MDADTAPSWDDVRWMREQWTSFMLKGVMRADDAKRAVDCGVSAISVSNHGGNNLDGSIAPSGAAAVVEAVDGRSRCCLTAASDGGDVVRAIALGHRRHDRRGTLGLAATAGRVENVLDILRAASTPLDGPRHSSIMSCHRTIS